MWRLSFAGMSRKSLHLQALPSYFLSPPAFYLLKELGPLSHKVSQVMASSWCHLTCFSVSSVTSNSEVDQIQVEFLKASLQVTACTSICRYTHGFLSFSDADSHWTWRSISTMVPELSCRKKRGRHWFFPFIQYSKNKWFPSIHERVKMSSKKPFILFWVRELDIVDMFTFLAVVIQLMIKSSRNCLAAL